MADSIDFLKVAGASSAESIVLSNLYEVKKGGFGDTNSIVTYACTLKVKNLKEDITTFKKLTEDKAWPVSQIIQREISRVRVKEISKTYILGEGRSIKYFPPLIIAILPIDDQGRIAKEFIYESEVAEKIRMQIFEKSKFYGNEEAKNYFINAENKSLIKNCFLLQINSTVDYNILCWDKTKYFAVVIDGQHRYEALLESVLSDTKVYNYSQDVVFVDLSFVLKALNQQELTPVKAVRTVFVDINNTAVVVSQVRKFLMDDKDLSSLFVQSLVNDENDDGTRSSKFIMPQLIDWHGESNKHSLPHITSILVLYQLMSDYVLKRSNLSSIDDLRLPKKVRNWVNLMNEKFLVDEKIGRVNKYEGYKKVSESLEEHESSRLEIDDDDLESFVFTYDFRVLKVAQETFDEKLCKAMVRFFNELTPYRTAIENIKAEGAFNKENTLYRALIATQAELKIDDRLKVELEKLKKKLEVLLSAEYDLIFSVLGQKALFDLFTKYLDLEFDRTSTEEKVSEITTRFINDVNEMFSVVGKADFPLFGEKDTVMIPESDLGTLSTLGTVATSFWESIIYQEKRVIYNTRGVASLRSVIEYSIRFIKKYRETGQGLDVEQFSPLYCAQRIRGTIQRNFEDLDELTIDKYAEDIITAKAKFLNRYLIESLKKES